MDRCFLEDLLTEVTVYKNNIEDILIILMVEFY
jgi:hypothetical protein